MAGVLVERWFAILDSKAVREVIEEVQPGFVFHLATQDSGSFSLADVLRIFDFCKK
jgi:GDP-D-mannose dehydratase